MSRVAGRNTKPEMQVRRALHAAGMRFRLHRSDLAGTPDIVLPKYRLVVFVHGCFWHRHPGCRKAGMPKSRQDFWASKFSRNMERDQANYEVLQRQGWGVVVLWECEVKDPQLVVDRVREQIGKRA